MDQKLIENQIIILEQKILDLSKKLNRTQDDNVLKELNKHKEILYHFERIVLILKYN